MKKACLGISIVLILLSLLGCNSDNNIITVKNGNYVMEHEEIESVLLPRVTVTDDEILFAFDMLSSYLPLGTYSITEDILTMTTNDNKYTYIFQIDGDNLIFQKDESSTVSLIDDRLGVKVIDKAIFHLENY